MNREVQAKDICTRSADREPERRGAVRELIPRSRASRREGEERSRDQVIEPVRRSQFNLTEPTGDFSPDGNAGRRADARRKSTKCFEGQAGKYGQNLVSTGRYMIAGSDKVDISRAPRSSRRAAMTARRLMTWSQPNYDPKTDTKAARENFPDQVRFIVNTKRDDIYNQIEAGNSTWLLRASRRQRPEEVLDGSEPRSLLPERGRPHLVHVHEPHPAALRRRQGPPGDELGHGQARARPGLGRPDRSARGQPHRPGPLFNNQLADYKPYRTPGDQGSVAKAKAALKGSKYDTDKNGTCGAKECKNILLDRGHPRGGHEDAAGHRRQRQEDRHHVHGPHGRGCVPDAPERRRRTSPIAERPGWGKDYADPYDLLQPAVRRPHDHPERATRTTPSSASRRRWRRRSAPRATCDNVPSINDDLDKCANLVGSARTACYATLDKKLMTQVVPWVPYLWSTVTRITSKNVTQYEFDQFATTPAYAHMAVK